MKKFRAIGDPCKTRHFYYSELEVYYAQWDKINERINVRLGEIAHLTDDQKKMITDKQVFATEFIEKVKADRAAKQNHEDPSFKLDEIINILEDTKKKTDGIFNLPPPKPKEEKKEEEKKNEDVPMEGEGDKK